MFVTALQHQQNRVLGKKSISYYRKSIMFFFNRIEIKSKFNYRPQDKTISFTCTYQLKGDLMLTESVFIHMLMPLRYRSIDFNPKSVDLYTIYNFPIQPTINRHSFK